MLDLWNPSTFTFLLNRVIIVIENTLLNFCTIEASIKKVEKKIIQIGSYNNPPLAVRNPAGFIMEDLLYLLIIPILLYSLFSWIPRSRGIY